LKVTKDYNLGKLHAKLAKEWHPTKNGKLTPYDVTPGSGKKVWWLCKRGHEWNANVLHRTSGCGCPECSGKKVGKDNNLAVKYPNLVKEWHPTKNGDLTPYAVTPGSDKKVWWMCSQGHEWNASVGNRARGSGCQKCYAENRGDIVRKSVIKKRGSLASNYPEIAKQWHPTKNRALTPYDVSPHSGRKVWWICNRGHEWKATVNKRTHGRGCPKCSVQSSRVEIRIYCELKTIFQDAKWREKMGRECDIYLPKYNVGVEVDGYPWHDGRNKEQLDIKKEKQLLGKGVEIFRVRDNRLKRLSQKDILYHGRRSEVEISVIKRLLKNLMENISLTHQDESMVVKYLDSNQFQNNQDYQKLVTQLPSPPPEKSLAYLYPQLTKEWNYEKNASLEPIMLLPSTSLKVWWKCSRGHEWKTHTYSRIKGIGCPQCYAEDRGRLFTKSVIKRRGSLATKYPEVAKQWHPTKNGDLTPYDVAPKSHMKVWWRCGRGHEWDARIADRTRGRGCPKCWNEKRCETYRKAKLKRAS